MLLATCATIAAVLSAASGGETIRLSGNCSNLRISRVFPWRIAIEASGTTVSGLLITGGNVTWRGGTIRAPNGKDGEGVAGYSVYLHGASGVNLEGVRFTGAKKSLVLNRANNIIIMNSAFTGVGEDGINASNSSNIRIVNNTFNNTVGKLTTCLVGSVNISGLSQRDCESRGGSWIDGYHTDAIQMRNGMIDVVVSNNRISGSTQGITQMDAVGDLPLRNVIISNNDVQVSKYHPITLDDCYDCKIVFNHVARPLGSTNIARIIPGLAVACGNRVSDNTVGTGPCQ